MNLRAAALAAILIAAPPMSGCAWGPGSLPAAPGETIAVPAETALTFYRRMQAFYPRLTRRRFNALDTFNDPVLRDYFRSPDLFFDYYADLAQALSDAYFAKSRPQRIEIQEFLFDGEDRARVQVRFLGDDRRPLRPGKVALIRRDRWERAEGSWWVVPGKF